MTESRCKSRAVGTRRRVLLAGAVVIAAITYLLVEGLGSSLNYFDTVAQVYAKKAAIGTSVIRLEGSVVSGSVTRSKDGATFAVEGGGHRIEVVNTGSPPGLFKAGIPIVVVGHFNSASSYRFDSDQIMVKHSATYIAAHPNRVRASDGSSR